MRHGKKINHLGRKAGHRQALLSNMAKSLIENKRITTTVAKAKALRKYIEPLITKAKNDTTHSRRTVFSYLQDKGSVATLFGEVAGRTSERPGGYTRIIRTGSRLGDNAETCMMELVDFNEVYTKETATKKTRTRRGRSKGKKEEGEETAAPTATAAKSESEPVQEEAPKTDADEKEEGK